MSNITRNNVSLVKKLKYFRKYGNLLKKRILRCRDIKTNTKINDLQTFLADFQDYKGSPNGIQYASKRDLLHNGSFHQAIGPVLVIAQCFCLMPVRGILGKSAEDLSFCWLTFRTGYCLFYMLATIVDTSLTINMVLHHKLDVRDIEPFIFHISIFLASIGFLQLAIKWPRLMQSWQQVEKKLPAFHDWREREELSTRIKTATFVLLMLSLTEHLLSTISAIHFANYCPTADDPFEAFFLRTVDHIFYVFDYSPWLAWMAKIENVLLTFGWTYMDIFIIIIAMGLSSMYKRIQRRLRQHQGVIMPESFWREIREQYTLVCELIEEVDEAVSFITMLSFASNLYFVCIQCLKSLNKMPSMAHAIYFYFSLMFLLARTLAVSLYLAEVNDRSRHPLDAIRLIPAASYYPEIDRLAMEINVNRVAMTGMKYFDITRKLVLTIAGTIVTYELVLIQFHEDQQLWHCRND